MRSHRSSQSKQSQPQPTHIKQSTSRLVKDRQVVHLILPRPKLFQNPHILDQSPNRKDRDGERNSAGNEVRELGEREVD